MAEKGETEKEEIGTVSLSRTATNGEIIAC